MCKIIHRDIKLVHLEMGHRTLGLLLISDLEKVFRILIEYHIFCLKANILQLTPDASSI